MANYEVGPDGTHAGHAVWGFHPQQENFVPTLTVPNPRNPHYQNALFQAVGGGVPPPPHAMTPRTQAEDRSELQFLLSEKTHFEMEIVRLQRRLDSMNVRIQALRARHEQLDH